MKISETHREILPIRDESDKEYCKALIDGQVRKEADIEYRKRGIGEAAVTKEEEEFQEKNSRESVKQLLKQPAHNEY